MVLCGDHLKPMFIATAIPAIPFRLNSFALLCVDMPVQYIYAVAIQT
jgi:hypothetical protein